MKFSTVFLVAAGIAVMTIALPLSASSQASAQSQQISQLPEDPLPDDPYDQGFDQGTYSPSPEDSYARGQQIGQSAVVAGAPYDPLSVCQHLTSTLAQQCVAGYHKGYGADLSSSEISSYYYSQGYQQGTEDAQAGSAYDPNERGYQNLPDNTTRNQWTDGYHEGYWEHVDTTQSFNLFRNSFSVLLSKIS